LKKRILQAAELFRSLFFAFAGKNMFFKLTNFAGLYKIVRLKKKDTGG